jgi:lysozyme
MTLIAQLKRDEGCRRVAGGLLDYRDSKGLWTRGYGHLLVPQPDPHTPKVISEADATALLVNDLKRHGAEVYDALPWIREHDVAVEDAVLNMAFNLGVPRLLGFKGFLTALRGNDYTMAVIEMLDSKWHRDDVGPRAVRLAKQIATRVYQ